MYIVYDREQYKIEGYGGWCETSPGIHNCVDASIALPDEKPKWLVRTRDWKLVSGSAVNDHYWALSYSWNQSGKIIHKGGEEYERVDEGKHTIVFSNEKSSEKIETKEVKFHEVIQQICRDVGINYIWWDQMCINQEDHDEKISEIKRMHFIYKNAICTLALIPELRCKKTYEDALAEDEMLALFDDSESSSSDDNESTISGDDESSALEELDHYRMSNLDILLDSQWIKRIWTLEEAYMSKNILFLGRNAHFFSNAIEVEYTVGKVADFILNFQTEEKDTWLACTLLCYARTRTSSKAHDRIFALANVLPDIRNRITFSYQQPLADLMCDFYNYLAERDGSILLFGAPIDSGTNTTDVDSKIIMARKAEAKLLPSWTGASGSHIGTPPDLKNDEMSLRYTLSASVMHLTSEFISVRIKAATEYEGVDHINNFFITRHTPDGLPYYKHFGGKICNPGSGHPGLTFVTTTSKSQKMYDQDIDWIGLKATHFLPLECIRGTNLYVSTLSKTEYNGGYLSLTEECSECIILCEQKSIHYSETNCYPVIKRDNKWYKSIGVCLVRHELDITQVVQPSQTFCIR